MHPSNPPASRRLLLAACSAALFFCLPAQAVKVTDFRSDQLMFIAQELKGTLNLTPNQQTLWQQVGTRSAALLRTRQLRRDRLQADLKRRLGEPDPDLRTLFAGVDEDAAAGLSEDRQLRELWLSVNDALEDKQRAQVVQRISSQLERVDADPVHGSGNGGREAPGRGAHGSGRPRGGGMGGPGG